MEQVKNFALLLSAEVKKCDLNGERFKRLMVILKVVKHVVDNRKEMAFELINAAVNDTQKEHAGNVMTIEKWLWTCAGKE